MNVASKIISLFGGQNALAKLLGKGQSTVQYWAKSGTIPAKWHAKLIELAQERGVNLGPGDFVEHPAIVPAELVPEAKWSGAIQVGNLDLPCYVLADGRRVISRTGATDILTEKKGGGNLESYIGANSLKPYLPANLLGEMIEFAIQGVTNKTVRGIEAETFLEICKAYVTAADAEKLDTPRQYIIAKKASMFLAAVAKVGLIALIDEATGYQYERSEDALRFKLKVYLEEEMRKWEPTFPNELWIEFGRLTRWKGAVAQRPKYWGKLVMELVYGYLDHDVADWLKANAPKPTHGQNYHQWLSSQYGLKKLVEHLWMLVGMARACHNMRELREQMAMQFGRQPVQYNLFLPPPARPASRLPKPPKPPKMPGESGHK